MTVRSGTNIPRHVLTAVATLVALGCGSSSRSAPSNPDASSTQVYTGQVMGTDARVAVVATAHRARFFFCGGPMSYATSTHWFTVDVGASGDAGASLPPPQAVSFGGQVRGDGVHGSVLFPDGTAHPFDAAPVAGGTLGGLYEADDPCGKVGLIVDQASAATEPTSQGACVSQGVNLVEQVTPLRPLTRASDGTIRVLVGTSTTPIALHAAAAPAE
jgi:hypothetical protein